jgi:hypothetical protein
VLTLRQLKDARVFFHNGSFTSVKDVVKYFNAGVPQDARAGAAPTLSTRFTHPRGAGTAGLGLSDRQVDDLTDFIENALYDPGFLTFDPQSPTPTFQLDERDTMYSTYRPDLAALGATDGRPASGRPQDNDDPLSRRDMGLEFLDVTAHTHVTQLGATRRDNGWLEVPYRITNNGTSVIDTHLLLVARGLAPGVRMANASGSTRAGDPYLRVFLNAGTLQPAQSIVQTLVFVVPGGEPAVRPALVLLSGQGNP